MHGLCVCVCVAPWRGGKQQVAVAVACGCVWLAIQGNEATNGFWLCLATVRPADGLGPAYDAFNASYDGLHTRAKC